MIIILKRVSRVNFLGQFVWSRCLGLLLWLFFSFALLCILSCFPANRGNARSCLGGFALHLCSAPLVCCSLGLLVFFLPLVFLFSLLFLMLIRTTRFCPCRRAGFLFRLTLPSAFARLGSVGCFGSAFALFALVSLFWAGCGSRHSSSVCFVSARSLWFAALRFLRPCTVLCHIWIDLVRVRNFSVGWVPFMPACV